MDSPSSCHPHSIDGNQAENAQGSYLTLPGISKSYGTGPQATLAIGGADLSLLEGDNCLGSAPQDNRRGALTRGGYPPFAVPHLVTASLKITLSLDNG